MKYARGTPFRFLALNGAGAAVITGVWLVLVLTRPRHAFDPAAITFELLALAAVSWVLLLMLFFRDPERDPGEGVVAPADGRVISATTTGLASTVSVFLGVFDVHVVRAPIAGRVTTLAHKPGGKRFAFSKDSALNERLVMGIEGEGESCSLTLIAGAFADRVLPYLEPGATVAKGARIGIIKFGSRVDLEYSGSAPRTLLVKPGDRVFAGRTSILLPSPEAASK